MHGIEHPGGDSVSRYALRSGRRIVAYREAPTAHSALVDYVRSLGCRDDEIVRMGENAVSWRGAVFRAEPAVSDAAPRAA